MHLMNEFFAKLSQDAGVTEFSIVSDGALMPRSSASLATQPRSPIKTKKDGKQQKFANQQEDRAPPLPPRKWESSCRSVNEDRELLEAPLTNHRRTTNRMQPQQHNGIDHTEGIQCTTRPGFETTLTNPSAGTVPVRPPTLPRRKESIDETALVVDDSMISPTVAGDTTARLKDLSTSSLGKRLAAVQLNNL